jgi:hypothetical protein
LSVVAGCGDAVAGTANAGVDAATADAGRAGVEAAAGAGLEVAAAAGVFTIAGTATAGAGVGLLSDPSFASWASSTDATASQWRAMRDPPPHRMYAAIARIPISTTFSRIINPDLNPPRRGRRRRAELLWTHVGLNSAIFPGLARVAPFPGFESGSIPSSSPTGFHSVIPT